jgi:hypothetical protein
MPLDAASPSPYPAFSGTPHGQMNKGGPALIHFTCPGCHRKLVAKARMAGQTRKCPKCGTPVQIGDAAPSQAPQQESSVGSEMATPDAVVAESPAVGGGAIPHPTPERLDRHSHYLVCGPGHLIAAWENNGRGWLLKTTGGMVSAVRNRDKLPAEGDFRLIELKLAATEAGHRLEGITCYQLARRWALNSLAKGDDAILATVTGPKGLSREQKNVVRAAIKERFMREVWEKAEKVLEYLGNADIHSARA